MTEKWQISQDWSTPSESKIEQRLGINNYQLFLYQLDDR